MKISTFKKVLALAVGMLLCVAFDAEAKPKKPSGGSITGDLVISKVFYNNMVDNNDKPFILANYIELFNNSGDTLDITGIYLGVADNTSSTASNYPNAWTATNMSIAHKDSIALKQIFQIPTDKTYTMAPGQSIVICNAAENHSLVATAAPDLSQADFEVKSTQSIYGTHHNDNVPELNQVFTYSEKATYIQFMSPGPFGLVLLAADTKIDKCPTGYYKGQTEGSILFKFAPGFKTIDAVDLVEHSAKTEPDASQKRMPESYDAGWAATDFAGANSGEALMRKTAFVNEAGRTMLFDTNNSSADFAVTKDLSIRVYGSEAEGLTDSVVVVPESGYLAINPSKPFYAPDGMVFAYVSASAKSEDFKYNEYPGDSLLFMAGDWIAIAKPGSYTLKLSEAQAALRVRSTSQTWCYEDHKELTGSQKTRSIYKFSNAKGKVGFQRVPATAEGTYNVADFVDGERLYVSLTPTIVANFAKSFGVTDLDFIPWHGITPESVPSGIQSNTRKSVIQPSVYSLQGIRLNKPQKGLNIVNGKIVVVK